MRTIIHLSDLHFGRLDRRVVAPLVSAIGAIAPDLVAVSGDFTQRARASQFAEARDFLQALPSPRLVVPGNHDVPLYDVARRFLRPLARYRRFIADDLEPVFLDAEIAALGLNSARSLSFGRGRIFHTTLGHDVNALSSVDFVVTFQRGTEWAASGAVTQKVPQDFPTATVVSYRADIASMDPRYKNGLNPLDSAR